MKSEKDLNLNLMFTKKLLSTCFLSVCLQVICFGHSPFWSGRKKI